MRLVVTLGEETIGVELAEPGPAPGRDRVRLGDEWFDVDARLPSAGPGSLLIGGRSYEVDVAEDEGEIVVAVAGETYRLRVGAADRLGVRRTGAPASGQRLLAPMPGRVVAVAVRPGDRVEPGSPLVVLEAMKMENEFRATAGGVVTEVRVRAGQAVNAGDLLVVVEPGGSEGAPPP